MDPFLKEVSKNSRGVCGKTFERDVYDRCLQKKPGAPEAGSKTKKAGTQTLDLGFWLVFKDGFYVKRVKQIQLQRKRRPVTKGPV